MIFDCCLLFNEVELLLLRMEYLDPIVDYFIITQSMKTFAGKDKELALTWNLPPSFEPFGKKIILCAAHEHGMQQVDVAGATNTDRFMREAHQRNQMCSLLNVLAKPGDVVLMSDVDEIPDRGNVEEIDKAGVKTAAHHLKFYRYYLNTYIGSTYPCTIQTTWPLVMTPQDYRNMRFQHPAVYGGWHFSSLYDQKTKLQAFAHAEYDTTYWHEKVEENKRLLIDPFNRDATPFTIEDPRDYFPDPVKDDPDRWGDWIYKQ